MVKSVLINFIKLILKLVVIWVIYISIFLFLPSKDATKINSLYILYIAIFIILLIVIFFILDRINLIKRMKISFYTKAIMYTFIISLITLQALKFNIVLKDITGNKEMSINYKTQFLKDTFINRYNMKKIAVSTMKFNISKNNLDFYFYNESQKGEIEKIIDSLPTMNEISQKTLPINKNTKLDIILYDDMNLLMRSTNNNSSYRIFGVYNNNKIDILTSYTIENYKKNINCDKGFLGNFIHEYTHFNTDNYLRQNNIKPSIPQWFNEGLATLNELEYKNTPIVTDKIQKIINLSNLSSKKQWHELSDIDIDKAYYESVLAIYSLTKLKGNNIITNILNDMHSKDLVNLTYNEKFEKVFARQSGYTIYKFEQKFLLK